MNRYIGALKPSEDFFKVIKSEFPIDFLSKDPDILESFGRDWTRVFPPRPSAIAFPRTTEEVARFLTICSEHHVRVVPSGGRTGLAGGAVAPDGEVVLSLSRMNRMDPVDPLSQIVRVQAGAVTEAVHHHCAPHGLTWPVDFASKGSSQVGGNIATNAGGVKVIHYGLTRNWVLGLQVVTMKGEILELNGALEKNNTGIDLRQLFIGTEGTLGIVTEATLKLTRLPRELEAYFVALDGIPSVIRLFQEVRKSPFQVMAFECLSENCLRLVTEVRGISSPFPEWHPAYVLFEVERPQSPDAQKHLDSWLEKLFESNLIQDGTLAQSPREAKELWSLRESITECMVHRGFVHKNDIALPIAALQDFIAEMYPIFLNRKPMLEVFLFGHIGDGNLHINTLKPNEMDRGTFISNCYETDQELFALIKKYQGSISAEHGIGLLKKPSLRFSRTPEEIEIMRKIKHSFDPHGLLNPGKIID